jgi:hypothetical protein
VKALFVYWTRDVDGEPAGGVQLCSREFLRIVESAFDGIAKQPVEYSTRLDHRIRRRLKLGSYIGFDAAAYTARLRRFVTECGVTHVFLNKSELIRFAPVIKSAMPDVSVIVMSHGNQTGDDLYEVSEGSKGRLVTAGETWKLGLDLRTESFLRRRFVDAVCVMSEEEAVLERWLGVQSTFVIPRIIHWRELEWKPVVGRVGLVGTLDHTPNRVALEQLLPRLHQSAPRLEVQLVGGPEGVGQRFEAKFPNVRYLGRLSEADLSDVVRTWAVVLNPVFWLSRGASMKLGQALSWCMPTVSTVSGRRGYELPPNCFVETEDACSAFARAAVSLAYDIHEGAKLRAQIQESRDQFIDSEVVAVRMKDWLLGNARNSGKS